MLTFSLSSTTANVQLMFAHTSQSVTECSQAIANAAKEAKDSNLSSRDSLRKVGAAFLSSRELSAHECVYRCMPCRAVAQENLSASCTCEH